MSKVFEILENLSYFFLSVDLQDFFFRFRGGGGGMKQNKIKKL